MNIGSGNMKCSIALNSIAARYAGRSMLNGYQTDCATAFLGRSNSVFDRSAPDGVCPPDLEELTMTTLSIIDDFTGPKPGAHGDRAAPCGRPRLQIIIN
jgi:hypothetical protein